jgi:hypothetical protein
MKPMPCERESLAVEAARAGCWDDDLRAHVAECDSCANAMLAAEYLFSMREADHAAAPVPHAGRVWWKAQLRARREAAERAARPISVVQWAAFACAAVALCGVCVWQWSDVRTWLAALTGGWHTASPAQPGIVTSLWQTSSVSLILGGTVILVFLSLLAYLVWSEE